MKKILFPSVLLFLISCGPAAENREQMHRRAKQIEDSMSNLIRSAIQEAEMPAQIQYAQPADTTQKNP